MADGSAVASGAIVVGLSMAPLERLQGEVLLGSIVVFVLVLLAGGLAIRTAVDGAPAPGGADDRRCGGLGAHDLDRRFGLGPARDEITGLAATLDGLLARIASSRRHEQRFASEVAHELRTPIAGMRGRAELALGAPGPGADAEREQALRSIVDQAARADAAIDALVAVARRELDPAAGTVDLAAIARELEDVRVDAPAGLPPAAADAEIARRVVATLVDNARRHGGGEVALELSAARRPRPPRGARRRPGPRPGPRRVRLRSRRPRRAQRGGGPRAPARAAARALLRRRRHGLPRAGRLLRAGAAQCRRHGLRGAPVNVNCAV